MVEMIRKGEIINAMTVDVEDYFQVSAFERYISYSDWTQWPQRAGQNTITVLDMLARHEIKATFFVLGWVAERYPDIVKRIVSDGHEVASHGFAHERLNKLSPSQFRDNVSRTKMLLEDITGAEVCGYRAPSYSISKNTLWAYEELEQAGYRYSSSIVPIRHDLYGMPKAPRFAFYPKGSDVLEIPVTTMSVFGHNWPCGGGGYFRLMPYPYFHWGLRRINGRERQSAIFYFHPWEIDPDQPRVEAINLKTRIRHYLNLGQMKAKVERLLNDFRFDRMDAVFLADMERTTFPIFDLASAGR